MYKAFWLSCSNPIQFIIAFKNNNCLLRILLIDVSITYIIYTYTVFEWDNGWNISIFGPCVGTVMHSTKVIVFLEVENKRKRYCELLRRVSITYSSVKSFTLYILILLVSKPSLEKQLSEGYFKDPFFKQYYS